MVKHIFIGYGLFRFDIGLITVEPILFLYMLNNFLYFPVFQSLVFDKVCFSKFSKDLCHNLKYNSTFKDEHKFVHCHVNSETSHWILRSTISLTVPSFIIVLLLLGALGDRIDRRIPVILPCVGALLSYLSGLINSYYMSASLYFILIGPILNGLCGGYIACLMAVYSYIGHISSSQFKMMRIGILESMVFLAGTIGVFLSGVILERQGYIFTFCVLIVIIVIAFFYSILWLDSIAPQNLRDGQRSDCCSVFCSFLKESFRCVAKRRPAHIIFAITLQVIAMDILMLCTSGDFDISVLHLRESLNFSRSLYEYYKGLDNFFCGLILVTVLPLVKRLLKVKNLHLVLISLLSYAANFVVLCVATKKWMPFLAAVIGMFKGVPSAGLKATMSSMVSRDEQGRLFGLIAASESLITLFASLLFNDLFPAMYTMYHGLVYLLLADLVMVVFFFILYLAFTLVEETDGSQRYKTFVNDSDSKPSSRMIALVNGDEERPDFA